MGTSRFRLGRRSTSAPNGRRSPGGSLPEIHFVYALPHLHWPSTVMRGRQLAEITRRALPEASIHFSELDSPFANSVLYLTKGSLSSVTPERLQLLKERRNRIVCDPVDKILKSHLAEHVDCIAASSCASLHRHSQKYPSIPVVLVDHHVDPRVRALDLSGRAEGFRAGYFGEIPNTVVSSSIEQLVDFIEVGTNDDSWLGRIPAYAFHYAVRSQRRSATWKPFTKGLTAAYCRANILVQDSEPDAVRWLGADYPYFFRGDVTEKRVVEALEHARDSFGSATWRQGLETMREIRSKTSEALTWKQLQALFDIVT